MTEVSTNPVSNIFTGAKRTAVPLGITAVVSDIIGHFHWNLTPFEVTAISSGVGYVYWFGVRIAEHLGSSKWGWLLGSPKAPLYPVTAA